MLTADGKKQPIIGAGLFRHKTSQKTTAEKRLFTRARKIVTMATPGEGNEKKILALLFIEQWISVSNFVKMNGLL